MTSKRLIKGDEDWYSWLASTGYFFPRNEIELTRYNKLFEENEQGKLTDSSVSVERILTGRVRLLPPLTFSDRDIDVIEEEYRMVARKGMDQLPHHIREKMKKNQQHDNNGNPEEEDSGKG